MQILFALLFFIGLLIESTVIQLPLTLLLLIVIFVLKKNEDIFLLAFCVGVVLDLLSFRTVGSSSIFFVSFLFLISLYDRKYEIRTMPFILIASAAGSSFYLFIDKARYSLILVSISIVLALVCFILARSFIPDTRKS